MRIILSVIVFILLESPGAGKESSPKTATQSPRSNSEKPIEENVESESDKAEVAEEGTDEDFIEEQEWFADIITTVGRRWYQNSSLRGDLFQMTTEWSHYEYPVRFGPAISYVDLSPADEFYSGGNIFELGFRVSTFYDMESFLPYLGIDYKLFSMGSIHGSSNVGGTESSGTIDFTSSGLDLVIGSSFILNGISIIIETSLYTDQTVKRKGNLGNATLDSESNVVVGGSKVDIKENGSYRSILLGIGFEV